MLSALRRGVTRLLTLQLIAVLLVAVTCSFAAAQDPAPLAPTLKVTSLGFGANQTGSGTLNLGWTGGNLGNTWHEGEWVPYQLTLENVQSTYPNLAGMPDIVVSYDFTASGDRFVDLVRGIQVGTQILDNTQGWPMDNGQPYPMTSFQDIQNAQNDVGNTPPLDNVWQLGGGGNFQLLNLPNSQINRALDGTIGTTTSSRHEFIIHASDLLAHGISATANTIVIYYQLHESRSFIWTNSLQAGYANPPTDVWGGYLYALDGFPTDQRPGSSFVPGSSGHVHLEVLGGSQDVPIPIPAGLPGAVSGLKWNDVNGNGLMDVGEATLSGWRITVSGTVEGILFTTSTLTDSTGAYSFPNLTQGTWLITEATGREVPVNNTFNETYPSLSSANVGVGTPVTVVQAGQAGFGWSATLTEAVQSQGSLNFGNRSCINVGATDLTNVTICEGGSATFTTTASGTGPFTYAWTKDGAAYSGSTNSITINPAALSDAGTYCVTVTGQCGTPVQKCATLTVNQNVAATALTNLTRCPGQSATFTTTASGTGPFTYAWTKDGSAYPGTTNSITIASVAAGDAGTYCVTVSGACGTPVQRCATLTVNQNVTATALTPLTRCPGQSATFTTTAGGTGPFTYAWTKDGAPYPGTTNSITIASVAAGDAGNYCVTVTGACGTPAQQCAALTVDTNVSTTDLTPLTRCPGQSATFTTTPSGTGPFTYSWTKDGSPYPGTTNSITIASVAAGDAGNYCVTVTGFCGTPVQKCATLTVNQNVTATALTPLTRCPGQSATFTTTAGGTGPFTYAWTKNGAPYPGTTNSITIASVAAGDAGNYCVTVTGACGTPAQQCATLTVNQNVTATALTPLTLCPGQSATFTTTAGGTGPFTYAWTKNGSPYPGTTNSITIASVAAGDAGNYCVTVTGACGTPAQQCATLTVNTPISTTGITTLTQCAGTNASFSTTASGTGPYTFVWTHNGIVLVSGGSITITTVNNVSTLDITGITNADAGTYCVTVGGACQPTVQECATLTIAGCDEFCSLTQGYWGNAGGTKCYNGVQMGTLSILQALITPGNPLVVGKPGRSLTVNDGSESCIISRLPGSGQAATLPSNLGDWVMSAPNCTVPNSMLKNGKFNNVLLGQTITLALNLRFDVQLGNLPLCPAFVTQAALPGPDMCLGTSDDVTDLSDPLQTWEIPASVFTALTAAGLPATPAGILELANRALAGQNTYGASLADIAAAEDAINQGFDECRFLMDCSTDHLISGNRIVGGDVNSLVGNNDTGSIPKQFALLANRPNPFSGATSIRFALPERSHVAITIFDIAGRKITTLVDSDIEAGYRATEWTSGSSQANGIYFYRFDATGLDSGKHFASTGKMILIH